MAEDLSEYDKLRIEMKYNGKVYGIRRLLNTGFLNTKRRPNVMSEDEVKNLLERAMEDLLLEIEGPNA